MWLVVKNLGWCGRSIMSFETKELAEAHAASDGGKVMTNDEYEFMRR